MSECGSDAIRKNSVINSFIETQRLTLSKEKSVVVHIGNEKKCTLPCPDLKVHNDPMDKKDSTKYLGNILSSKGGVAETIEDRRTKGWGKVAQIMGILGVVDMGAHRLEVGLLLREAILVNSLLYSAEAWSGVTEKQLARLEVVDSALFRQLTGGHSKCASEFHHLETGTLKLRHTLTYLRLLYHHNILARDENETINKIYRKQNENCVKGDWYNLLLKDFEFIEKDLDENEIASTSKEEYKKKMKLLVQKAALKFFMKLKEGHKNPAYGRH